MRPFLTQANKIILGFILFGILFAIGIVSTIAYSSSFEVEQRYDDICPLDGSLCTVQIPIDRTLSGMISVSYKLTKFHQNHRRFVYSRNALQLAGFYVAYDDLAACKPYRSVEDRREPEHWILPSGAFAHWVFNDTFVWGMGNASGFADMHFYPLNQGPFFDWNITFDTEWAYTYVNLSEEYTTGRKWMRDPENGYGYIWYHPGYVEGDPHFIRWMRTEAASTCVKEYAKCVGCTVEEGVYEVGIYNRYPTSHFGGTKSIVVTERSAIGDRSLYLGVMLLVVAVIVLGFTIGFLVAEFVCPRSQFDG
jgi:hypothetical protein